MVSPWVEDSVWQRLKPDSADGHGFAVEIRKVGSLRGRRLEFNLEPDSDDSLEFRCAAILKLGAHSEAGL